MERTPRPTSILKKKGLEWSSLERNSRTCSGALDGGLMCVSPCSGVLLSSGRRSFSEGEVVRLCFKALGFRGLGFC